MSQLDVYREWLQITDTDRPLNHYQLLRLSKFEDDIAKIRKNYRTMNAHVRKYSSGAYAKQSQELLNELAKAMLCLTDARRKREYDITLGREKAASDKRQTFEELLLSRGVLDSAKLKKARDYANAIGVEVRDAVVQQKLATQDVVMELFAESIGLPYLDLSQVTVDMALITKVPAVVARQHSCVPVMLDQGQLLMASPNPLPPDVEDNLRLRVGASVRTVLCTAGSVNDLINKYFTKDRAQAEMAAGAGNVPVADKPGEPKKAKAAKPARDLGELMKIRAVGAMGTFTSLFVILQLAMPDAGVVMAGGIAAGVAALVVGVMVLAGF